jgi:hypothetical protein
MMVQDAKKRVSCSFFRSVVMALSFALAWTAAGASALAGSLEVKVIHATRSGVGVDAELGELARDLKKLNFTSFKVLERSMLQVTKGATSRFKLPNGLWMEISPQELSAEGVWRLQISSKKIKFKSVVAINPGGTVAVGGPGYKGGALIFALTRTRKAKKAP